MENLELQIDGAIGVLTFNRPGALNALNSATVAELTTCLRQLHAGQKLRVLIVTGAGKKAFVAGADIKEMSDMSRAEAWDFSRRGNEALSLLEDAPFATVAAVNGFALGGGCELAIACDLVYASDNAVFAQPEVNLGVIPGFGGTQRLTRLVGAMVAREMVMTGRMLNADDALRIGLAAQVFEREELMDQVHKVARTIAGKGPLAVRSAKRVLSRGMDLPLHAGCHLESEAFADLFATSDQKEGMAAFIEKRTPEFSAE